MFSSICKSSFSWMLNFIVTSVRAATVNISLKMNKFGPFLSLSIWVGKPRNSLEPEMANDARLKRWILLWSVPPGPHASRWVVIWILCRWVNAVPKIGRHTDVLTHAHCLMMNLTVADSQTWKFFIYLLNSSVLSLYIFRCHYPSPKCIPSMAAPRSVSNFIDFSVQATRKYCYRCCWASVFLEYLLIYMHHNVRYMVWYAQLCL